MIVGLVDASPLGPPLSDSPLTCPTEAGGQVDAGTVNVGPGGRSPPSLRVPLYLPIPPLRLPHLTCTTETSGQVDTGTVIVSPAGMVGGDGRRDAFAHPHPEPEVWTHKYERTHGWR